MDKMGNVLCSLDSSADFPPLNLQMTTRNTFSILGQWEDMDNMDGSISISSNESNCSLLDNSLNMDKSFQEALSREKAPIKRPKDDFNFVTLKRTYMVADSRKQHSPSKKVSEEDSGWWKISGKKVAPENMKII